MSEKHPNAKKKQSGLLAIVINFLDFNHWFNEGSEKFRYLLFTKLNIKKKKPCFVGSEPT